MEVGCTAIVVYSRALAVKSLAVSNPPRSVTVSSPAKINLFLAVTGRRDDGYHDLVSLVAPLTFGDELTAEVENRVARAEEQFRLECDVPEVPVDGRNLVLQAAAALREVTGWTEPVMFRLTKRIPLGAGLGGGSSNAVAALRALNQLSGAGLGLGQLTGLAARVGSDCALFLHDQPVIIRGRGERVEELPGSAVRRLRGRRVLLFKPAGFGVNTAWAYAQMAAGAPATYLAAADAERRLADWIAGEADATDLLFNNIDRVVFRKYLALPVMWERLRTRYGLAACLSGSGSAGFALLPPDAPVEAIAADIREAWGSGALVQVAQIA